MIFLEKLKQLRSIVKVERHRYQKRNGVYEVEVQAGDPCSAFPCWSATNADINLAMDKAIGDALDYWTSIKGGYVSDEQRQALESL